MSMVDTSWRWAVRSVIFPLQERLKGHSTFAMLREMEQDERRPAAELQELQQRRLRQFLKQAAVDVPYYCELFCERGIDGGTPIEKIPFLTKDIIRSNRERMKSRNAGKVITFNTGGSTGEPLVFYLGPTRVSSDVAARWRAESWWGLGIGDREYVIWGAPIELNKQDRVRMLRDQVMRTRLFSAFEMSPEVMTRYLDEMFRAKAPRVFGYPSCIALLCEHARAQGRDLKKLGTKAVFVTAEYLWDHWRQTIAESFGCPVVNGYGGRDAGFLAQECPAGGMHITADRLLLEMIGEDGQPLPAGETGEIVVTHFDTPEMPFIRYRTGDMGALASKPCSCGRTLPLLERVEGRKTDFIVAPDGRIMHGLSVIYVLREIEGIEKFRIHQKGLTEFDIAIVRRANYDAGSETRIRQGLEKRLKAALTVDIRYVDQIPVAASGKYRYVISDVAATAVTTAAVG